MPSPDPRTPRVHGLSSALTFPSSALRPPPFFPALTPPSSALIPGPHSSVLRPPPSALLPGPPPFFPYTGGRMLEKRVGVSLCLTLSHAKNASDPGKRAPQVIPWS